jgi:regulator of protease activity HflC (stomatin/prohibitin superfamily)
MTGKTREIVIKDTHRALLYRNGVLVDILGAGKYKLQASSWSQPFKRVDLDLVLVDMRERDLTIKGQEILTADKVAIRVSIIVQFRVTDPKAAVHEVENYQERLYTDVQLAARRSLASMTLEAILTNRNQLSEDILRDVTDSAARYGVSIARADVKDLIFPGNLQEIMNKVLAAERTSQAQLVEARTRADVQRIDAQAKAEAKRIDAAAQTEAKRLEAEAEAVQQRIRTEAEIQALQSREQAAAAYNNYPALLRLHELETLSDVARSANARLYINFDGAQARNGESHE